MRFKFIPFAVFVIVLSGSDFVNAFELNRDFRTIGKDYITMGQGSYDLEAGLTYYELVSNEGMYSAKETRIYRTTTLAIAYGLFDHISVHAKIPHEYRGSENFDAPYGYYTDSEEEEGMGDVSAGVTWGTRFQDKRFPSHQVSLTYVFPTGPIRTW